MVGLAVTHVNLIVAFISFGQDKVSMHLKCLAFRHRWRHKNTHTNHVHALNHEIFTVFRQQALSQSFVVKFMEFSSVIHLHRCIRRSLFYQ